jgi:hypothetical protein
MASKKSNKPGAAKYPKMTNQQIKSSITAMKNFRASIPRTTKK